MVAPRLEVLVTGSCLFSFCFVSALAPSIFFWACAIKKKTNKEIVVNEKPNSLVNAAFNAAAGGRPKIPWLRERGGVKLEWKKSSLKENTSSCTKFLTFLSEGSLLLSVFGCFYNIRRYSFGDWEVEADPGLSLDWVDDWTMSSEGRILGASFFPH